MKSSLLKEIAAYFGIKIHKTEKAKHAFLTEVYIADNQYVLRSRPLLDDTIVSFLKEQALLQEVEKLISVQFPRLLKTRKGEKYIIQDSLLWNVYPLIRGDILCAWYELEKLDKVAKKNVFTTLKEIHTKTAGKLSNITSGFHLLSDVRKKLSEINTEISQKERNRVERALKTVEKIENNLSSKELCFIHGDYHPGNIIFQGKKMVGLIDTDWARIGYYLEDLAYTIVMFLRDYRKSQFEFPDESFEEFIEWYNVPKEHISRLKEYIILYVLYDVHLFKNLPQLANHKFYFSYQQSFLKDLCKRFK